MPENARPPAPRELRMARALLALGIMEAESSDEWPAEAWIERHWKGYSQLMRDGYLDTARSVLRYVKIR